MRERERARERERERARESERERERARESERERERERESERERERERKRDRDRDRDTRWVPSRALSYSRAVTTPRPQFWIWARDLNSLNNASRVLEGMRWYNSTVQVDILNIQTAELHC